LGTRVSGDISTNIDDFLVLASPREPQGKCHAPEVDPRRTLACTVLALMVGTR
jgi:hypothetical protein